MKLIKVDPKLEELYTINRFIQEIIQKEDFEVTLITEEIFVNIINYSDADYIKISADFNNETQLLCLEFIDNGVKFNPLEKEDHVAPDTIEETEIGGLGIHFVTNLADSIKYNYDTENHLIITKKVK
ncbi:ATP-binding protein [Methanosphaera sp. ISO3-F5]|uniref:ATP-binding protein n=1 Tax=Methanosphaera sp. ISO3-F5 TaxID=1452353 RepID=UPI002B258721|nr:ATP-binding protein [Methanosphaera sp. ISO3-F5]WQH63604.1 ATP-binding protein [Methanosphaera sp. ISO3-F5]